jgi:2-desacetyl-2-hydroxyethyl bacteriochlorophyllide A dehydrogenase
VGYNVGTCGHIAKGDAAIVIGDGMVGHWSAQTLQTRGARVMLLGRHDSRLALFNCSEGDCCVNEQTEDVAAAIKQWAPNGVQFVADTVGSIDAICRLMPHMRHFGHLVSAGFYGNNGQIDIQKMRMKELCLHAPAGWSPARLQATMDLIHKGELTTRHLITSILPASQASAAFNSILNKAPGVLGVVLDWREVNGQ